MHLEEDAWKVLVDSMESGARAELFFYYPGPGDGDKCWRPLWEQVRGLTDTSAKPRQGGLFVKRDSGMFLAAKIVANHTYPIPDGWYTFIGTLRHPPCAITQWVNIWVVGRLRQDGKFGKVAVVNMVDDDEMFVKSDFSYYGTQCKIFRCFESGLLTGPVDVFHVRAAGKPLNDFAHREMQASLQKDNAANVIKFPIHAGGPLTASSISLPADSDEFSLELYVSC
ncbi:hypothetical protein EV421DRAFT_2017201 [Armillaria borealis]|uniref:Uncharacterized protein n=1 Tax=Armillaria borealis TaxID=47425 RepID=A0AA39MVP9_9AGAR|nr:hypothetical protein EV421DRAFT_2017201 [Armillaria borealis]